MACSCGFDFCDLGQADYCYNCDVKHTQWHALWENECAIYGYSPTLIEYERIKAEQAKDKHVNMIPNPAARFCNKCEQQVNVSNHVCKATEGKDWLDVLKELP